jgi:hypothetical protein
MARTRREPLALVLLVIGVVTIGLGLLWWPSGVAEWGGLQYAVIQNSRPLVSEGRLPPDPPLAELLAGMEGRISSRRFIEAAGIILTGAFETACGVLWPRRSTRPDGALGGS